MRDFYYALFYFWFRFDLLTRRRENKALKALGAVTILQVWLALGGWWWCERLLRLPSPPFEAFLAGVVALFAANYAALRRGGWEDFERRFVQRPARERKVLMLAAAIASVAAFAILVTAAEFARGAR